MSTSSHGTTRARRTLRILQDRITSGQWPLNSKIPTELELAAELEVGRSTIREAVRTLANVGMLEPARSRGTFVRSLTPVSGVLSEFITGHDARDLLETRTALEVEAARLAAVRHTDADLAALRRAHAADVASEIDEPSGIERGTTPGQFHALLFRATHNKLLIDFQAGIQGGMRAALRAGTLASGIDTETRHRDHAELLEAIASRDPERAARAASQHALLDLVIPGETVG